MLMNEWMDSTIKVGDGVLDSTQLFSVSVLCCESIINFDLCLLLLLFIYLVFFRHQLLGLWTTFGG